jgi:GH15 family glucan-1,4-alpha-glucosidase
VLLIDDQEAVRELLYRDLGKIVVLVSHDSRAHYFLPERIGGDRNYDYCIAWVCDACLSLALLARLGKVDEVQHYFDWLCGLDSATDAPLRVCYRLGGSTGWTSWSFRRCAAMPQQADTLW